MPPPRPAECWPYNAGSPQTRRSKTCCLKIFFTAKQWSVSNLFYFWDTQYRSFGPHAYLTENVADDLVRGGGYSPHVCFLQRGEAAGKIGSSGTRFCGTVLYVRILAWKKPCLGLVLVRFDSCSLEIVCNNNLCEPVRNTEGYRLAGMRRDIARNTSVFGLYMNQHEMHCFPNLTAFMCSPQKSWCLSLCFLIIIIIIIWVIVITIILIVKIVKFAESACICRWFSAPCRSGRRYGTLLLTQTHMLGS